MQSNSEDEKPASPVGILFGMAWIALAHLLAASFIPALTSMNSEFNPEFRLYCMSTGLAFMAFLALTEFVKKTTGHNNQLVLVLLLVPLLGVHLLALFVFQMNFEAWNKYHFFSFEYKVQKLLLIMGPFVFLALLFWPYKILRIFSWVSGGNRPLL